MKQLNSQTLKKFLELAGKELQGQWLLVGGTLLPAVGLDIRSTIDIDLIGLSPKEAAQNLELMTLAEKIGLSVESVNQAAAFFLDKIKYTKTDLIPLHKGKKATIFRPSFELYLQLKLARLSPTDAIDCRSYYQYCLNHDKMDAKKVSDILQTAQRKTSEPEKAARLKDLIADLSKHSP